MKKYNNYSEKLSKYNSHVYISSFNTEQDLRQVVGNLSSFHSVIPKHKQSLFFYDCFSSKLIFLYSGWLKIELGESTNSTMARGAPSANLVRSSKQLIKQCNTTTYRKPFLNILKYPPGRLRYLSANNVLTFSTAFGLDKNCVHSSS